MLDNILNYKLNDLTIDVYFKKNRHQYSNGEKIFPKITSIKHFRYELVYYLDKRVIEEIELDLYRKLNELS